MATSVNKTNILFCPIFITFLAYTAIVNGQNAANADCKDLEGTWAYQSNASEDKFTYFLIKKKHEDNFLISTSKFPSHLPFKYHRIVTTEPHIEVAQVEFTEFINKIENATSKSADDCLVVFHDYSTMAKVQSINTVHMIYMNHLDVGYNVNHFYPGTKQKIPGYAINVLNWYFQIYFPRAIKLADQLRALRGEEKLVYTTHPWLVNLYLDCPKIEVVGVKLECPTEDQLSSFRKAVWKGDIVWHAGPLNLEPEAANPELFSYSLTLSEKLDKYFGLKKKARTFSQRDIPGLTQAAIPYLLQHNIAAISVGTNPRSAPPDVPSPNVWKFGNFSIITYWHKGGYPTPAGSSPKNPGGLSRKDCQFVKGLDEVLCFAFRSDNLGPPDNVEEVKQYYNIVRAEFPGAKIKASTFEDFTALLIPLKKTFPVVTKEIGDTWIQGPASDPIKMSHYRTISRLWAECLVDKKCDPQDRRIENMSRYLVKLPEHTYGMDRPNDNEHMSNDAFYPLQYTSTTFKNETHSWLEQRYFNQLAINALEKHPLAAKIKSELKNLEPYLPDFSKYKLYDPKNPIKCQNGFVLKIGPRGELVKFQDETGKNWADEQNPIGRILYRTFDQNDYTKARAQYAWSLYGAFYKFNIESAKPESKFWDVQVHGVYVPKTGDPCAGIYVRVMHTDEQTWFKYGAPLEYLLKYTSTDASLDIEYQFFNKPSTRLPESLYLLFQPIQKDHHWFLHKLGYLVDPVNVVNNGSQYVHGIDKGVAYLKGKHGLFIESLDVGSVAVQTKTHSPNPLPVPLTPMETPPTGMAFNFYNNIWSTNFIFWYPFQPQDKHYKARFKVRFV